MTTASQIILPVIDLCRSPEGPRDRQLLFGDTVSVTDTTGDWCHIISDKDGYHGYVKTTSLGPVTQATHLVTAAATHVYTAADFKSPELLRLSFGSRVSARASTDRFIETPQGFVPAQHLAPSDQTLEDPAAIAALFLGAPYLWGGNSRDGIDCSGLVQASLLACGIPCAGDSAEQQALGTATNSAYRRNDLLFWKGHVALVTDPDTLIHANAGAMACVYEPITEAISRIEKQGDGPVTAHRRLYPLSD